MPNVHLVATDAMRFRAGDRMGRDEIHERALR